LADDLLATMVLARDCPLLVAPAMNRQMWENPATQRNVAQLQADGVQILGPASGEQACGEVGAGRMLEPEEILEAVIAFFTPKVLAGKKVLITPGRLSRPSIRCAASPICRPGAWAMPSPARRGRPGRR
jgi:phosphopantothenoylcysteine decarboxylase/phosphopantothenate--cysteine ligase